MKIDVTKFIKNDISLFHDSEKLKNVIFEKCNNCSLENHKPEDYYINLKRIYHCFYRAKECCGEDLEDNWDYCPYCGNFITEISEDASTYEDLLKKINGDIEEYNLDRNDIINRIQEKYIAFLDEKQ